MLRQSFQHLLDLSQRASLHLRACIKSGPQYSHERRDTIKIWHVGYLGSIHYICMSPRTKARNLINSFMRSSSILNIVNEERNKLAYKCCKRGKNHDLPQISQTRKEHIVHATFNLGYDQCHLCHHHHQKQLFREMPALMPALAHPVDHSGSHIHLFTKARMTKAPPENLMAKAPPLKNSPPPHSPLNPLTRNTRPLPSLSCRGSIFTLYLIEIT